MAEQSFYQATAFLRWPKALHSGNGPWAVVVRFEDRIEVTLHATHLDAEMLSVLSVGRIVQLPAPPVCNESFGYREKSATSATA
jgi:hypothetical protein